MLDNSPDYNLPYREDHVIEAKPMPLIITQARMKLSCRIYMQRNNISPDGIKLMKGVYLKLLNKNKVLWTLLKDAEEEFEKTEDSVDFSLMLNTPEPKKKKKNRYEDDE